MAYTKFDCDSGDGIVNFYTDKTVFITGATGFLGKVILEKLLRTCNTLQKVFLLVREKKGVGRKERFDSIFSSEIWKPLRQTQPDFKDKIHLIEGDLVKPYLGLSEESIEILKNEVNIIFHCGATVRFDQHIRTAAYINVRAVQDLMDISRTMKNLEVFVHISTAYSNCPRSVIHEKFYDPPIKAVDLLNLVEMFDDKKLTELTPALIGEWPNTYTYTKAVTEAMIEEKVGSLPIIICRPAIITAAVSEPLPGWIDNLYGPSGVMLATGIGILRAPKIKPNVKTSIVPSDYVVNWTIAASYYIAERRRSHIRGRSESSVPIFNYCSPEDNTITFGLIHELSVNLIEDNVPSKMVWVPSTSYQTCEYHHRIAVFLYHMVPAYLMDFGLRIMGREPTVVKIYEKIHQLTDVLTYFSEREWEFNIDNTKKLWRSLSSKDQNLFPFNMENLEWERYFATYGRGVRLYLAQDPIETLPEAKKRFFKMKILYYFLWTILIIVGYFILRFLIGLVMRMRI